MRSAVLLVAIALVAWFFYSRFHASSSAPSSPTAAASVKDGSDSVPIVAATQHDSGGHPYASDSSSTDTSQPQPTLVEVPLSTTDRLNLVAAPQVFLNQEPSSALAQAMTYGRIVRVRADRVDNGDSTAVQGWIYYSEVAGYTPMVLCVSETFPVLDWMHCQEHSDTVPVIITTGH